ncbi:MAG: hypothetical protein OK439_04710 [Thaumarchaeota archaeon]|nr:hypothetical protein [Nitrososphaerota archaeon]
MYVRLKTISGRRYVYLVQGERKKGKVVQQTISYLGPLSIVTAGISDHIKRKVESNVTQNIDWVSLANRIREIPISYDELDEMRRRNYSDTLRFRKMQRKRRVRTFTPFPKDVFGERTRGELQALAKLSATRFKKTFEKIGDREYRMRL